MAVLAAAGIVGPLLFTLIVVVQGFLQPDYSHLALPISALAAWPHGWMQTANFFVLGPLMIAFAVGLHRGVRPTRGGGVGPSILVLTGLGILLAGIFPWAQDPSGGFIVPVGHRIAGVLVFAGAGLGLIVVSRRLSRDPLWRSLAGPTLLSGITIAILFAMTGALAVPDDGPLHAWGGLLQRLVLAVWFPCTIVLALRLLRVSRRPHRI